jgi:uroporphyrinogen-III synthase
VVTRPKNHGGTLVRKLEELGAIPMLLPVTEIAEPLNLAVLDSALKKLGEFDWMVFTSPNGVESVARRFAALGLSFAQFPGLKIAVVGPATAEALAALGRVPDAMPSKFISDEIAGILPAPNFPQRFLDRERSWSTLPYIASSGPTCCPSSTQIRCPMQSR